MCKPIEKVFENEGRHHPTIHRNLSKLMVMYAEVLESRMGCLLEKKVILKEDVEEMVKEIHELGYFLDLRDRIEKEAVGCR